MEPIIRKLKKEDASELAQNIAEIWNDTYKGIVSDKFLSGLYDHVEQSAQSLQKEVETNQNFYVIELNNKIIGWSKFDFSTDKYQDAAEIHSLYVLKAYHKKGYGRLLLEFVCNKIKGKNINKVIIGCLEGNPSNEFYKHIGCKFINTSLFREEYTENIYLLEI